MCSRAGSKFVVLCVLGLKVNLLCYVSQGRKEMCCAMCPRTGRKFIVLCVLGLEGNLLCYVSQGRKEIALCYVS